MFAPHTAVEERETISTPLSGRLLLEFPLLNKGTAFSEEERHKFELLGLLPPHVATMEEQLARCYENYQSEPDDVHRHVYLQGLRDRNEVLFFRLLLEHITEMMPIVYTPVVGEMCQKYSRFFRSPRGLYISYPNRNEIDQIFRNTNPISLHPADVKVIVVTDGERILGLGDLGVGGMGIPIGKLSLYSVCAGIHPATTLPIVLDVGTNNKELLDDPLYLGWRHERLRGAEYDEFIEAFVEAVMRAYPNAVLQWEDFAKDNASRLLERYRDRLCTFNDDIQGTGAVTLAGVLSAMAMTGAPLAEQRIVIYGAGSAAHGISDQIVAAMIEEGVTADEARSRIWLLDSRGLILDTRDEKDPFKKAYAQPAERVAEWNVADQTRINLEETVRHVHPTVLLGTSAIPGSFTEEMVREMAIYTARPLIFPLSNPTSKSEAIPADLLRWTDGRALVATGSPFAPVRYEGRSYTIGQCNNSFIFPGVGLGIVASGATRVTDEMFVAAARALSTFSPARTDPTASLFPPLTEIRDISRAVAIAVGEEAQRSGHAPESSREELEQRVDAEMWYPRYPTLRRTETE